MTTIFSDPRGLQMDLFLQKYQNQIKDKHILYVVSTNLEEDEQISRSTRGVLGGVNLKIGKATANAYARLKAYTNMGSNYTPRFVQSGIRVLYARTYQKRKQSQTGRLFVDVAETLLKRVLNDMNKKVKGRGAEIFNIDPQELFQIIEDLDIGDVQYQDRRKSERIGKRLLWLVTDALSGKDKLVFAEDYDEVLKQYALTNERDSMDERSKYITRYFIRPVNPWKAVQRVLRPQQVMSISTHSETETFEDNDEVDQESVAPSPLSEEPEEGIRVVELGESMIIRFNNFA